MLKGKKNKTVILVQILCNMMRELIQAEQDKIHLVNNI